MKCLLAVESEIAENLKNNLKRMEKFKSWDFEVCDHAEYLAHFSFKRPDVVVVSRYLPGEKPSVLLENMQMIFPTSRIVLLVGRVSETAKVYIKLANKYGLNNIVTGVLPGDRPYILPAALMYDIEEITGEKHIGTESTGHDVSESINTAPQKTVSNDYADEIDCSANYGQHLISDLVNEKAKVEYPVREYVTEDPLEQHMPPHNVVQKPENVVEFKEAKVTEENEEVTTTEDIISQYMDTFEVDERRKGVRVITTSNKGGVGKTTVAITTSIALAKSGVKTCLTDFDFEGPNVATFFGVDDVPGIEVLAENRLSPTLIDDLLIEVKENLYIIPGVMNKTSPYFETGKLDSILDYLANKFSVVLVDTPPEFWSRKALTEVFKGADLVLSVVDQSKFSEDETKKYAPKLLLFGVAPNKIRIVLNKYSRKLHNAKIVEKHFNHSFKKDIDPKMLPRVVATIPNDWDAHVGKGYKGEVVGLDQTLSQWHKLAAEIAHLAGYKYAGNKTEKKKKSLFGGLFGKLKKSK
ncbi:ParA family protein [Peptococcaceae bacterium 1198_IL3148]